MEEEPEELVLRDPSPGHWLTRWLILRSLGVLYVVAFAILLAQQPGLLGPRGILPVGRYLALLQENGQGFWDHPSLFWWSHDLRVMQGLAGVGLLLGLAVTLGIESGPVMLVLWLLYLSFVHVGQVFFGFGWEILLLEAGFLAVFLASWRSLRPLSPRHPPPALVIWLYRWLTFRVMFGAGLIKIRGDACWRDLTCLATHFETQPNPHPLSPLFHRLPAGVLEGGVLFNHVAELLVPFALFLPRPWRSAAGVVIIAFQLSLVASGNLAFLNWLTIAIAWCAFDDEALLWALPSRFRARLAERLAELRRTAAPHPARRYLLVALALVIGALSLNPLVNMLSPRQAMNRSFDRLHLVNTYGAFGSVSRERLEVVIAGSLDRLPPSEATFEEYELPCKPTRLDRRPCLVTPYHYRLDWQLWFVPFSPRPQAMAQNPWLVSLVRRLLDAEPAVLALFERAPFLDRPPRYLRIDLYRYRFSRPGETGWWQREWVGPVLAPVTRDDPALVAALERLAFVPDPP
ncbi:MAG: lipase maturation factor family protein [Myxococcales bacterium]|nr:lipase maturation factor family protein [Myxococcales bacterium]